jgi:uncharacterized membrane protein YccC
MVDAYARCLTLRHEIEEGLRGAPKRGQRRSRLADELHRDRVMALLSAFAAAIAIFVCCVFWIMTAWTNGSAAAMMAAVFCCFFATMDNPVPMIRQFLIYTAFSIPVSAVYLLGILPALHSFEMLALGIFPVTFLLAALSLRPALSLKAMAMLFGVLGALALQDSHASDVVSFIDSMLAQLAGTAAAAIITAIFRSISADRAARRIQAANWKDLAVLALRGRRSGAGAYTSRMLDRIGLLQPRLALATRADDLIAEDALLDLRIGNDIVSLQRARRHLPMADPAIRQLLAGIAGIFNRRSASQMGEGGMRVLAELDRALVDVTQSPAVGARRRAVVALVGLRCGLFPHAPGYQPAFFDVEGQPA